MKFLTAVTVASGFIAAPLMSTGSASAWPSSCDGVDCVPGVARNAVHGHQCNYATRYDFGVDSASGGTLICTATGKWVSTQPLVGVRPLSAPCYGSDGTAQTPDGLPMSCNGTAWVMDFDKIFYSSPV